MYSHPRFCYNIPMLDFFFGQEEFNIEAELEKLKAKTVDKAFLSTNYKVKDNPQPQELIELLRTPPLMFGKVLAVINCEKYFIDAGKGKVNFDDKELTALEAALQDVGESLHVVFVCRLERDSSKKIDSRRKLYKILTKYASAKEFPEFKAYQQELKTWIQKQARSKDLMMSSDVVNYLVERLGTNLRVMDNELEKLKLLIYPEKNVKKEDVKKICAQTEDIFLMTDYILEGRRDLAMNEYQKLCAQKHYLEILAVLQTNFSRLLNIKIDSMKLSPFEIAGKLHVPEFIVKKQIAKLKNVSLERLIQIRRNLLTAETRIKTGEIGFYDLPVEMAVMS